MVNCKNVKELLCKLSGKLEFRESLTIILMSVLATVVKSNHNFIDKHYKDYVYCNAEAVRLFVVRFVVFLCALQKTVLFYEMTFTKRCTCKMVVLLLRFHSNTLLFRKMIL